MTWRQTPYMGWQSTNRPRIPRFLFAVLWIAAAACTNGENLGRFPDGGGGREGADALSPSSEPAVTRDDWVRFCARLGGCNPTEALTATRCATFGDNPNDAKLLVSTATCAASATTCSEILTCRNAGGTIMTC